MVYTTESTDTGGPGEGAYYPAHTESARVVGVNPRDWSVDVVGSIGNKRWFDLQWNSALLGLDGEGFYGMPEVGWMCWVHTPSDGRMATPFVLGFKTEFDQRSGGGDGESEGTPSRNYNSGRQSMNPGDIMMRTRDENAIILRRGGVVQVLATPICQRLYLPIGNIIQDISQSYSTKTFAGDLDWVVNRTDQSDAGEVTTALQLRTKLKASDPGHVVTLRHGSHDDDESLRLTLVVRGTGEKDAPSVAQMTIDKDGNVKWVVAKTWTLEAAGQIKLSASEGAVIIEALKGDLQMSANANVSLEAKTGTMSLTSKGSWAAKGAAATLEGKTIALKGKTAVGGPGGQPVVLGAELVTVLTELIEGLVNAGKPHGPANSPPGFPVLLPVAASLLPKLPKILSTNNTTT